MERLDRLNADLTLAQSEIDDPDVLMEACAALVAEHGDIIEAHPSMSGIPWPCSPVEYVGWIHHQLACKGHLGRGPDCHESEVGYLAREIWMREP